jgi:thioredoxin-like negative regulator of GroEL
LPVVESLAREFAGRARVVTVHVDRDGQIGEQFDARGLPSYLVFLDGREVNRINLSFVDWFLEARFRRILNNALKEAARSSQQIP